jgi:ATP-dependent Lon protease
MLSALRKKALVPSLAMTGEITLRGRILPIGGLKEKILAAHRAKIKKVLIPIENKKDLVDIPKEVLSEINIVPVETLMEVIKHSFSTPRKRVVSQVKPKAKAKRKS